MKNQGNPGTVALFVAFLALGGLYLAYVADALLFVGGLLLALLVLVVAGAISRAGVERPAGHAAQAESAGQSNRDRLDREATERVRRGEGCHRIPNIDGIGRPRQNGLGPSDFQRVQFPGLPEPKPQKSIGVARPQLDDPDIIDGEVTDIAGWLTG